MADDLSEYELVSDEEKRFRTWYEGHAKKLGINPDPYDKKHLYDYRGAFNAGVAGPDEQGHWPSKFKMEGHPNLIVDGINTKTGEPVKATPSRSAQRQAKRHELDPYEKVGEPPAPTDGGWGSTAAAYAGRLGDFSARQALRSATGLGLAAIADPATQLVNYGKQAFGGEPNYLPSQRFNQALDYFFPPPQTGFGELIEDVGSAVGGTGLQGAAANALTRGTQLVTSPVARNVLSSLGSNLRGQMISATSGSTLASLAKQAGLGPWWQIGAGLVGGALPGAPRAALNALRQGTEVADALIARSQAGERLTPTEMKQIEDATRVRDVNTLHQRGVTMTPGQIRGGAWQRFEEAQTSNPVIGDVIKGGLNFSLQSFNRVIADRVLAPLGIELPQHVTTKNRNAVAYAHDRVHDAFDTMKANTIGELDMGLRNRLFHIRRTATHHLPPDEAARINYIFDHDILGQFPPQTKTIAGRPTAIQPRLDGHSMQRIRETLNRTINDNLHGKDAYSRQMATGLIEARNAIDDMMVRQNPQYADRIGAARDAYHHLKIYESAAAKAGGTGLATPAQYQAAVREHDLTMNKNRFAGGRAYDQDLSDAGKRVLPPTVPDSGTPLRNLWSDATAFISGDWRRTARLAGHAAIGTALSGVYGPGGMNYIQRMLLDPRQNALQGAAPAMSNILAETEPY